MKNKKTYNTNKLFEETEEIIKMMEDVFGHRVTQYSPKDTSKLKNKLRQPVSDKERDEYVAKVEPRMDKKSIVPPGKDKNLDSFLDLDTRISQKDYDQTIDLDSYKTVREPMKFKQKEEPESEGGEGNEAPKK
jgi:hypothetical protein